jgi:glucose uptake protein
MILPYGVAIIFCVLTMICWGSWPSIRKMTSRNWRFELFYRDYIAGILLFTLLMGVLMGNLWHFGRSLFQDLRQSGFIPLFNAFLSGVLFNLANILFAAAIAYAGMAVALPVGGSIALMLGVMVNYIAAPRGNRIFIFLGMGCIFLGMVFSGVAHLRKRSGRRRFSRRGAILAIIAGVLYGFFYRLLSQSAVIICDPPDPGKLLPFSAAFVFALGAWFSNMVINGFLTRHPFKKTRLSALDYLFGSIRDHLLGLACGVIWGLGLSLNLLAAGRLGYSVSFGLSQGNAMIAAIWGVFIWKEFAGGRPGILQWLVLMFLFYITGVTLLALAR